MNTQKVFSIGCILVALIFASSSVYAQCPWQFPACSTCNCLSDCWDPCCNGKKADPCMKYQCQDSPSCSGLANATGKLVDDSVPLAFLVAISRDSTVGQIPQCKVQKGSYIVEDPSTEVEHPAAEDASNSPSQDTATSVVIGLDQGGTSDQGKDGFGKEPQNNEMQGMP